MFLVEFILRILLEPIFDWLFKTLVQPKQARYWLHAYGISNAWTAIGFVVVYVFLCQFLFLVSRLSGSRGRLTPFGAFTESNFHDGLYVLFIILCSVILMFQANGPRARHIISICRLYNERRGMILLALPIYLSAYYFAADLWNDVYGSSYLSQKTTIVGAFLSLFLQTLTCYCLGPIPVILAGLWSSAFGPTRQPRVAVRRRK